MNNDPDSPAEKSSKLSQSTGHTGHTVVNHSVTPYYNVLLTKRGVEKLKHSNKTIFDLPLADLREPPHMAQIYTIGDLVRFLDQHQYIRNAVQNVVQNDRPPLDQTADSF